MSSLRSNSSFTGFPDFLAAKAQLANSGGFEPDDLPGHLFDYQRELVEWAVRQGRGALFADCGLGKPNDYIELGTSSEALGYSVTSPAELHGDDVSQSWDWYLRRDIAALVECDEIALLPGWMNSRGARLEHHVAAMLGMPERAL